MKSNLWNIVFNSSLLNSVSKNELLLKRIVYFSSIPSRPRREDFNRRTNTVADEEEDSFLRNLNFRDGNDMNSNENSRRPPVREASEHFFADLDNVDDHGGTKKKKHFRLGARDSDGLFSELERSGEIDSGRLRDRRSSGLFSELENKRGEAGRRRMGEKFIGGEQRGGFRTQNENFNPKFGFGPRREERNIGLDTTGGPDQGSTGKEKGIGETLFEKLNLGYAGKDKKDEEAESKKNLLSENVEAESSQDADEIFKKMKETGLIPNAVAMLDGLCKDGLIQEAMKLFGLMREKGTIPEVVIYTAVVEGFCKAAKFDDAKRTFRKMLKNGIEPNAFSYGILVQGLTKGKRLEDAVEFCMDMLDAKHLPNAATFTGLVDGFCKEKGVEEAEAIVRRLRERGYAMDDRAVREHLDKRGPFSPMVWEAIFGKKASWRPF